MRALAPAVTLNQAESVTATSTLNSYTLTTPGTGGTGSGSIGLAPAGAIYTHGTIVTATATAATGSTFGGWSGACAGVDLCTVTMNAPQQLTATFALNIYALTVAKAGTGSGLVASATAGINCGDDCEGIYPPGTVVTLTVAPATGSTFAGWSGACAGAGACAVTLNQAESVTATFTLNSYALITGTHGTGSGIGQPRTRRRTLYARRSRNRHGDGCHWLYLCGLERCMRGVGLCTVTMSATQQITANLYPEHYALAVAKAGAGSGLVASTTVGINCGDDCEEIYAPGTVVTLTVAPATGSTFAGWDGACAGTGQCVVVMGAARQVTATFVRQTQLAIQSWTQADTGKTVEFTATLGMNSFDTCIWDFNDGITAPCQLETAGAEAAMPQNFVVRATHTYSQTGDYVVTVTASNPAGIFRAELPISVGRAGTLDVPAAPHALRLVPVGANRTMDIAGCLLASAACLPLFSVRDAQLRRDIERSAADGEHDRQDIGHGNKQLVREKARAT